MKYDRLAYLEKAFADMSTCYDHVSARCIEAEKKVEELTKLVCLLDQQKMKLFQDLRKAVKEYPLVRDCLKYDFPELEVKDE